MTPFPQVWDKVLAQPAASSADVVFSITEDMINSYLQAHFANDNDKYRFAFTQQFQTSTGAVRKFDITLAARAPLNIELPPLSPVRDPDNRGPLDVPTKPRAPALHAPQEGSSDPNIRVRLDRLALSISWDKLDGSGRWTWTPSEISAHAECFVSLHSRDASPTEEVETTGNYLTLTPISIAFSKTDRYQLSTQFQAFINTLKPADQALVMSEAVDKFDDLIVIALNIIAAKAGPQMVTNIQIPSPVILNRHIVPAGLLLSDKQICVALAFDHTSQIAENRAEIERGLARLDAAIHDDLLEYGGYSGLAIKPGQPADRPIKDIQIFTSDEILLRMTRTTEVVDRISADVDRRLTDLSSILSSVRLDRAAVLGGIGLAVDEALLSGLAQDALPAPQNHCSDWVTIVEAVRGRACYWARMFDATVSISGTTVSGSVGVNAGGDLEACIRKFWDCSWSWDCGSLGLWVSGYPGISISLKSGAGLAFTAQLTGGVSLGTNLPFPFDKVIAAVSGAIIQFIMAVVNLFIRNITVVIAPPAISLPSQKTKILMTRFSPISYQRPGGNDPRHRFIGFVVDTDTGT
jgi:hypothetical protein